MVKICDLEANLACSPKPSLIPRYEVALQVLKGYRK
jgi:hypothetical protein